MKIKSNYKDYYDNIAHIYGGGDPKIVYVRPYKLIEVPDFKVSMRIGKYGREYFQAKSLNLIENLYYRNNKELNLRTGQEEEITEFRIIIVGDSLFTQIKRKTDEDFRLVREGDLRNRKEKSEYSRYHWKYTEPEILTIENFINYKDESLIDVCKRVGFPVFMLKTQPTYRYNMKFVVCDEMPNLGKIGMGNFIDANTMYQNISYLVGNIMKDCPDTTPVPIVTDKDKILGHGFDLKTSFRGKV